jgi:methylamine--corrinoid protein Co-methyltransferase
MGNKEWGLSLFRVLEKLVAKYQLQQPVPEKFYHVDNHYADDLFDAAVDLLVEAGVYCTTTQRVITLSEREVLDAVRETPSEIQVGAGREQRIWKQRDLEDTTPPNIDVSGHGPWSDKLIPLPLIIRELARHPRVDLIEGYMYAQIDGREVHGKPLQAYASRRAIEQIRAGLSLAGRRDLAITHYPVITDAFSLVAPLDSKHGLRPTDGVLLTILPDLVVEEDLIAAAVIYNEHGCYGQCGGTGVGPFGGSLEGQMIEATAGPIIAWIMYRDTILTAGSIHNVQKTREISLQKRQREVDWRSFAVQQAHRRHTNQIFYQIIWGESVGLDDLISEQYLLNVALSSIKTTLLGLNFRVGCTNPPTFTSWVIDTSDAALKAHLTLDAYDELARQITKEHLGGVQLPPNAPFRDKRILIYGSDPHEFLRAGFQAYDWYSQAPTDQYLRNENRVRKYLRNVGLPL